MRLVYEQCIYAHVIEVFHIVRAAVEHFLCLDCRVLLGNSFLLLVVGGAFLGYTVRQCSHFRLQVGQFFFGTSGKWVSATGVCLAHLFKYKHLLVYLVLHELHLTLIAVGNKLKGALRHNNHVPIVVLDFGIEVLSALCVAVVVLKREYLGIGVEFLG